MLLPIVALCAGCLRESVTITAPPSTAPPNQADLGLVLSRVARPDGLDVAALKSDPAPLERYLAALADFGPASARERFATRESRLAYRINAYHAAMLRALRAESDAGPGAAALRGDPLERYQFRVDGALHTSADLRRAALAESPADWRVPLALSGWRRGDPPMPVRPFVAEVLDWQLQAQALVALRSSAVMAFDHDYKYLRVHRDLLPFVPELIAQYNARHHTDAASLLNVLVELLPEDRHADLNAAVGYPVAAIEMDRTPNIRQKEMSR